MTPPPFRRTFKKRHEKPHDESDTGSSSLSAHRSKPSYRHGGKDSPSHQSRRKKEDYSTKRHHRNHHKGPFTRKIAQYPIPRVLAKLPKLETYDVTTDHDEHVEHIDTVLDYHQARGVVKCKQFVLCLKGADMTWSKGLEDNPLNSWKELCDEFASHFTARRKQPKTMAVLNVIIQEKKETLIYGVCRAVHASGRGSS